MHDPASALALLKGNQINVLRWPRTARCCERT